MSLSEKMIEWLEACEEYRTEYKKALNMEVWDIDYYLYHERQRMEKLEREYLEALREALHNADVQEPEE